MVSLGENRLSSRALVAEDETLIKMERPFRPTWCQEKRSAKDPKAPIKSDAVVYAETRMKPLDVVRLGRRMSRTLG